MRRFGWALAALFLILGCGCKPTKLTDVGQPIPAQAGFVVVADARSDVNFENQLQALRESNSEVYDKVVAHLKEQFGIEPAQIANCFQPSGFVALLPLQGPHLWVAPPAPKANTRAELDLLQCKRNLKNLATACEMYATDYAGHYPRKLQLLSKHNYLKDLPACPSSGTGDAYIYSWAKQPDNFTLSCAGHHAPLEKEQRPAYTATEGLISDSQVETQAGIAYPDFQAVPLVGIAIRDEEAVQALVRKVAEKLEAGEASAEGQTGQWNYLRPRPWSYAVRNGWLLISDSAGVSSALAALEGQKSLSADATFQNASQQIASEDFLMVYAPLKGLELALPVETDEKKVWTDAQTAQALQGAQYLVASLGWNDDAWKSVSWLRLDPRSTSPWIRNALTPSALRMQAPRIISQDTDQYIGVDLGYLLRVAVATVELSPYAREFVGRGRDLARSMTGLDLEKTLGEAFTGEVGYSHNMLRNLPKTIERQRLAVRTVSCDNNLKNIATTLEMYSTDFNGRYPDSLARLTPNYLRYIPNCPAAGQDTYSGSYQVAAAPDLYTLCCKGHNHPDRSPNHPAYDAMTGLNPGRLGADAPARPMRGFPDTITFYVGVRNVQVARDFFSGFESSLLSYGMKRRVLAPARAGEGEIVILEHPQADAQVAYTILEDPTLAIFAMGPDSLEAVSRVREGGAKLSHLSEYQEALRRDGGNWVTLAYSNFTTAIVNAAKAAPEDTGVARWVQGALGDKPVFSSLGFSTVEKEGLRTLQSGKLSLQKTFNYLSVMNDIFVNFHRARSQGMLTACKSNEKNIATALEMYASDNVGRYPDSLARLTPNYLRYLPECPAARKVTYDYQMATNPDAFTIYCKGENHAEAQTPANYPHYNSVQGLIER